MLFGKKVNNIQLVFFVKEKLLFFLFYVAAKNIIEHDGFSVLVHRLVAPDAAVPAAVILPAMAGGIGGWTAKKRFGFKAVSGVVGVVRHII